MFIRKISLLFLIVSFIVSCSSEEPNETSSIFTDFDINEVVLEIRNIQTNSATVYVSGTPVLENSIQIEFKKENSTNYQISNNYQLLNLERGTRYLVRAAIEVDDKILRTEAISFVTNAFQLPSSSLIGEMKVVNQEYNIINLTENSDFLSAPEFEVFVKYENDSIRASNVQVINDSEIVFTIDDTSQTFFDNESSEYKLYINFSVILKSGDFMTEVSTFDDPNYNNYIIFNRTPNIRYIAAQFRGYCQEDFDIIEFIGYFWSYNNYNINGNGNQNINIVNDECCFPDDINIRITNIDNPDITRTFFSIDSQQEITSTCDISDQSGFLFLRDLGFTSNKFHFPNKLRLHLLNTYFIPGNYSIEFNIINNSNEYLSDKFYFEITTETVNYDPPYDN